ncbi:hypothetical protein D046_1981B, partial [Vibrio parahaemolyticus V-223/04]
KYKTLSMTWITRPLCSTRSMVV